MLVKIPSKFLFYKDAYKHVKERHLYLNTDMVQSVIVDVYDYDKGLEYNVTMNSMQGYITMDIMTCATKELKDEFLEWLDEMIRKDK